METADYTVLQAKRITAVINFIPANGKMTCVCVASENTSAVLCAFLVCARHVSFSGRRAFGACVRLLVFLLVNASSAYGCGSVGVRFSAALT